LLSLLRHQQLQPNAKVAARAKIHKVLAEVK
jgi:hypothetical protein